MRKRLLNKTLDLCWMIVTMAVAFIGSYWLAYGVLVHG